MRLLCEFLKWYCYIFSIWCIYKRIWFYLKWNAKLIFYGNLVTETKGKTWYKRCIVKSPCKLDIDKWKLVIDMSIGKLAAALLIYIDSLWIMRGTMCPVLNDFMIWYTTRWIITERPMPGSTIIPAGNNSVSDARNPYTNTWVSNICLLRALKNVISNKMKCSIFWNMLNSKNCELCV